MEAFRSISSKNVTGLTGLAVVSANTTLTEDVDFGDLLITANVTIAAGVAVTAGDVTVAGMLTVEGTLCATSASADTALVTLFPTTEAFSSGKMSTILETMPDIFSKTTETFSSGETTSVLETYP